MGCAYRTATAPSQATPANSLRYAHGEDGVPLVDHLDRRIDHESRRWERVWTFIPCAGTRIRTTGVEAQSSRTGTSRVASTAATVVSWKGAAGRSSTRIEIEPRAGCLRLPTCASHGRT